MCRHVFCYKHCGVTEQLTGSVFRLEDILIFVQKVFAKRG